MALNTIGDIITEVLVRNSVSTTDGFVSDTNLKSWVNDAHVWAAAQHPWAPTEGRVSTTFASTEEWNFEGYKSDSFRILQIGGKRLQKLAFNQYQIFREEEPSSNERVYSDYGRIVFINPNVDLSGTLTAWGQYQPTLDTTDLTSPTVFSNYDEEANEAMVEKMSAYLKRKLLIPQEAELHDKRASDKLNELYKKISDEQYEYQTHPDSGGMFKRFDVLRGRATDELIKRDQF